MADLGNISKELRSRVYSSNAAGPLGSVSVAMPDNHVNVTPGGLGPSWPNVSAAVPAQASALGRGATPSTIQFG